MFSISTSVNTDSTASRWLQCPCRAMISRQCFFGFLFVCSLVVFTPLLFTEKVGDMRKNALEFRLPLLSELSSLTNSRSSSPTRSLVKDSRYPIQPSVCSTSGQMSFVVLFIPSRPQHADERAALRESWGFHARLCHVRIIFGMGSVPSTEQQHELFVENSVYGDVLQTSEVVDAYHNQTRLILSFFQWGLDHCRGASFIGKADEDSWINIFGVLHYLSLPQASSSIVGHFLWNENVKRLVEEKWYLTKEEYANDTYPPFAVGQLYIFPFKFLSPVMAAALKITIHWLDDVFIAGQIPALLKMNMMHIRERADLFEVDGMECIGRDFMIIHAVSAERKRDIFYEPCMVDFRKKSCRASLPLQRIAYQESTEEKPSKENLNERKYPLTVQKVTRRSAYSNLFR